MYPRFRFRLAVVCLGIGFGCGGCTLVKPVVGVIAGPANFEREVGPVSGAANLEEAVGMVAGMMAIGVVSGLATGIASDVMWLAGSTDEPLRNWFNPFRTNAEVVAEPTADDR